MTHFVNPHQISEHRGVERMQTAAASIGAAGSKFRGAKGLVAMLLAGAASALIVVADQVVSTWADGRLLLAWVALWALVFAAIALFADASRGWTATVANAFERWSNERAERANDERIWSVAQSDPRFMADIQAALMRTEREALAAGQPAPEWPFAKMPLQRVAVPRSF